MADNRLVFGLIDKHGKPTPVNMSGDEDLEAIAESTLQRCTRNERNLRALDLSGTFFTSVFLTEFTSALHHNTELQEVYLDKCRIGDEGARLLAHGLASRRNHTLRLLSLDDNEIRCRGTSHLARIFVALDARWGRTFGGYRAPVCGPGKGLQHFSLKGNGVASIGAKALGDALAVSDNSLETLNLNSNLLGDWAVGWLAMVLRNNNVLRCIDLRLNPIGLDGVEELRSACQTAKATLVLVRPGEREGEDLETVVAGRRLITVYITEPTKPDVMAVSAPRVADHVRVAAGCSPAAEMGALPPRNRQPVGAFRPGSASRRQAASIVRLNTRYGFSEPAALMADSAASCTTEGAEDDAPADEAVAVAPCASRPMSAMSNRGFPSDDGGGATLRRSRGRKSSCPAVSTFAAQHVPSASEDNSDKAECEAAWCVAEPIAAAASRRERPGERGVASDEKETATALVTASRWRRKPRDIPQVQHANTGARAHASGCGVSAARRLPRTRSAPNRRRCGMLMGPTASVAMCM
eukprot:TRINITY_DN68490_c0_g1_i1.p1 TRINITY_DN68490_c0_g1~~TRINITY_DN68490_c0_g1_i1.p1  ORF type:complete len:540 (+),score=82.24 TRINITY_DN68490_c0_g1_i1:51-1622(+)